MSEHMPVVSQSSNLPVKSMNDLAVIGDMFAKSGMFGVGNPGAGFVVATTCYLQHITPLEFIRTYHIINNTPTMKSGAMAAEFRNRGGKYKVLSRTTQKAEAEFSFEGQKIKFAFTMKEAREQGTCFKKDGKTLKDNWQNTPTNMLWARMMSNAIGVICPEINYGISTPEEVIDIPATVNVTMNDESAVDILEEAQRSAEVSYDVKAEEVAPAPAPTPTPKRKASKPKETPFAVTPEAPPAEDFSTCPIGKLVGTPWAEMSSEHLQMALGVADLAEGHKKTINEIMAKRGETANA